MSAHLVGYRFLSMVVVVLLTLGLLAACGSSGGGEGSSAVRSQGEITDFGSIWVNGVRYHTGGAELEIEGVEDPNDDSLKVGMIVEVEGRIDDNGGSGTAVRVRYEDNVKGPVLAIDETSAMVKVLNVLGQTVIVTDGLTQFDNTPPGFTFATLVLDNVVEVSGQIKEDGSILATYIQRKALTTAGYAGEYEVKGMISGLAGSTFQINDLTVDATGITPSNGTLEDGRLVEVKGSTFNGTTLIASSVEIKTAGLGDDIAKAQIEGFITALSGNTMMVGDQEVDISNATYRGGVKADLLVGVRVQAQGQLQGGLLIASKVTFKESARFESNAININGAAGTLELEGLPGITVLADSNIAKFSGTLTEGKEVRIRARQGAEGVLIATRLEADAGKTADEALIRGPVANVDAVAGTLEILGVEITVTNGAEYRNLNDNPMTRAAFFAALGTNQVVKARYRPLPNGGWDRLELEND
jgi:hypothetical protein